MGVFIPGIVLYILLTGRFIEIIKKKEIWQSLIIFILLPIVVYGTLLIYFVPNHSLISTAFIPEIVNRFAGITYGEEDKSTLFYFFTYLDSRYNLWNYLFYVSLTLLIINFIKNKTYHKIIKLNFEASLLLISILLWLPLVLFISFASYQHHWYLTPLLPFIAITCYEGLKQFVIGKFKYCNLILAALLLFTISRQFYVNTKSGNSNIVSQNIDLIKNANLILLEQTALPNSNILLEFYFANQNIKIINQEISSIASQSNSLIVISKWKGISDYNVKQMELKAEDKEYYIFSLLE